MVEARFKLRHPRLKDFSWHWKPFGFTLVLAHAAKISADQHNQRLKLLFFSL
jgi:hypothetical protein